MLSLDELRGAVGDGTIDTVCVAFTDMQGRLMGKRLHAGFFLDEVGAGSPVEGCNYLLGLDMEMDPQPGYEIASWERGYGDFALRPDLATLRRTPWLEAGRFDWEAKQTIQWKQQHFSWGLLRGIGIQQP